MAEKTHKYTVTLPDGGVVTRTTHRTYTHVIIGKCPEKGMDSKYCALTWAGTPALAMKAKQTEANKRYLDPVPTGKFHKTTYGEMLPIMKHVKSNRPVWIDVRAIPVKQG
jgi:hypothetical protein